MEEISEGKIVLGEKAVKSVGLWRLVKSVRFGMAILVLFAVMVQYAAKIDLSVNIVCMVNHTATAEMACKSSQNRCNATTDAKTDGPFSWASNEKANLLAAFFYGYLISEIPGGILAERIGSKLVLGFAVILNSLCAWHYGSAANAHLGVFIFLRILVGFACGTMLPAISHVWTAWAPSGERSFLIGVALSGAHLAPIIMLPLGGALCGDPVSDWKHMFFVVASIELAWVIVWFIFYANTPRESRFISEEEIAYINSTIESHSLSSAHSKIPWKAMFTSRPCWALFICHTCANWGLYTLLTEIPSYMKQVLQLDIKSNGLYSAIPYGVIWITTAGSSYIADVLLDRQIMSRTTIRKVAVGIGTSFPAIFLTGLGFMKQGQDAGAVTLLAIGQGMFGVAWGAGHMCNANDLAPVHAGVLFGVSNTFATVPGIITPYVTAALTKDGTQASWQIVFGISSAFFALAGIIFSLFGDGNAQQWDSDFTIPAHHRSVSSIQ